MFTALRRETVGEAKGVMENVRRPLVAGDNKKTFPCFTGVRPLVPLPGSQDLLAVQAALADPFVRFVSGELSMEQQVETILALVQQSPQMRLSGAVAKREAAKRPATQVCVTSALSRPALSCPRHPCAAGAPSSCASRRPPHLTRARLAGGGGGGGDAAAAAHAGRRQPAAGARLHLWRPRPDVSSIYYT